MTSFIEELLRESEQKDKLLQIEMNRLRADQILAALTVLEQKADDVNKLADDEIKLIEEYRLAELQKIEKKATWLSWQLEQFIRSTGEKSINLPHGTLKLRLGRDKVEITDLDKFMRVAQTRNLLRPIPESYEPDLQKTLAYVKMHGFLTGVKLIAAQSKFSYKTLKGKSNGEDEAGTEVE